MKSSRCRLSLASVVMSKLIFESDENVPSSFSWNVPAAPLATSTASDGRLTPTSCSRTRTVAFEVSLTVHIPPAAAVAVVVGVGDVVATVGVALDVAGAPPQAATSKVAIMSGTARAM